MKSPSLLTSQVALWGICLIGFAWLAITISFEIHLGWPSSGIQFAKRVLGWGVEVWLVRTLVIGARRCASTK